MNAGNKGFPEDLRFHLRRKTGQDSPFGASVKALAGRKIEKIISEKPCYPLYFIDCPV
jgi:hypothetical protein